LMLEVALSLVPVSVGSDLLRGVSRKLSNTVTPP